MKHLPTVLLFIVLSFVSNITQAGSEQNSKAKFAAQDIASFAKQVEKFAAEKRAHAFIIGRLGQPADELPKGIQFTHTAIAIYSQIKLANGDTAFGYAIHNLYQDSKAPDNSNLVTDYPVDFFWGAQELKAGIIIPDEALQLRIVEAIENGVNKSLHNANYSIIANPYNNQYQNCTEHTLNIINAAIYQTDDMPTIKQRTKSFFKGQKVHVNRFKLALGNMFADGVSTSDHQGKIQTTTFTSIARYLDEYKLLNSAMVITPTQNSALF